jgi:hypothetical protein
VLKKAGIVVAAAAAGLLAVSPLAFAGESHGKSWGHGKDVASYEQNTEGLINVTDTNINPAINICDNQVPVNVLGVQVPVNDVDLLLDLTGALGLPLASEGTEVEAEDGATSQSDDCVATTSTDTVSAD